MSPPELDEAVTLDPEKKDAAEKEAALDRHVD
jgi:hypothetical protein